MNKKIVAMGVLMLMMCAMVASVFAEDNTQKFEYEYTVTVYYDKPTVRQADGTMKTERTSKTYTVYATSAREAEVQAQKYCESDYGNVASCGGARATGRKRIAE